MSPQAHPSPLEEGWTAFEEQVFIVWALLELARPWLLHLSISGICLMDYVLHVLASFCLVLSGFLTTIWPGVTILSRQVVSSIAWYEIWNYVVLRSVFGQVSMPIWQVLTTFTPNSARIQANMRYWHTKQSALAAQSGQLANCPRQQICSSGRPWCRGFVWW